MGFLPRNFHVELEIEQLSTYLKILSSSIDQIAEEFRNAIEEEASKLEAQEQEEFFEFHHDEYIELSKDIPRLLYSSFVVSWYSFVERSLLNVCNDFNFKISITVSDEEFLGRGIRRARNLLIKSVEYEIDNSHWAELSKIGKIRNTLVHSNNIFPVTLTKPEEVSPKYVPINELEGQTLYLQIDPNFYQYLKNHSIITYAGSYSFIETSLKYCNHLLGFAKDIFSKIYSDLQEKVDSS